MKRFIALFAFLLISLLVTAAGPVSASAGGGCYTQAEAEAEQGIRIHSELMVIGLNCQAMHFRDGTNLYAKYRQFTAANANLFANYETQLMGYFKKRGDKNPEASLNTLRTNMANKIALDATKMQPYMFCNHYASRVIKASAMDTGMLRQWASTVYPGHPLSQPLCSQPAKPILR
jgi:hypothetical protein